MYREIKKKFKNDFFFQTIDVILLSSQGFPETLRVYTTGLHFDVVKVYGKSRKPKKQIFWWRRTQESISVRKAISSSFKDTGTMRYKTCLIARGFMEDKQNSDCKDSPRLCKYNLC